LDVNLQADFGNAGSGCCWSVSPGQIDEIRGSAAPTGNHVARLSLQSIYLSGSGREAGDGLGRRSPVSPSQIDCGPANPGAATTVDRQWTARAGQSRAPRWILSTTPYRPVSPDRVSSPSARLNASSLSKLELEPDRTPSARVPTRHVHDDHVCSEQRVLPQAQAYVTVSPGCIFV
jgi:hypothetical protein